MPGEPIIVTNHDLQPGGGASGVTLAVANWPTAGTATEVALLHVHHADAAVYEAHESQLLE